jgi:sugar phosphate isomerase/epimerase
MVACVPMKPARAGSPGAALSCRLATAGAAFSLAVGVAVVAAAPVLATAAEPKLAKRALANPFFVFNNGVKDETYDTPAKQVALAKRIGFAGIEKNGLDDLAETLAELDRQGLELFTVYVNVNLDAGQPAYDERLPEAIRSLKGRRTMLWIHVTSRGDTYAPSSREGDAAAVRALTEVADMARASGLRIMVYPHVWLWLESVPHAIELVEKIGRPDVGLTFNLPHWLAQTRPEDERGLRDLLVRARPHLFAVSVNGATKVEADKSDRGAIWKSLIQPLGEGTFDTCGLLGTLVDLGFDGPVGLQCYNVPGDKAEHLARSMAAWRACQVRIAVRN